MNPRLWKRLREVDISLQRRADDIHRELYHTLASEYAYRYAEQLPPYPKSTSKEALLEWLPKLDVPDPTAVGSVGRYFLLAQAKALVAKYDYPTAGLNQWAEDRAFEKFATTEQKCKEVNEQLSDISSPACPLTADELSKMRGFIAYVLRDVPRYEELANLVGFGPGAALGIHGKPRQLKGSC